MYNLEKKQIRDVMRVKLNWSEFKRDKRDKYKLNN